MSPNVLLVGSASCRELPAIVTGLWFLELGLHASQFLAFGLERLRVDNPRFAQRDG